MIDVAAVDSTGQLQTVLDLPSHLLDALARVEAAGFEPRDPAGLAICGMGGSGIGAALAVAAIGDRATKPIVCVRDYALPKWVGEDWTVLLSSYSGGTAETLACWDTPADKIVVTTGGVLGEKDAPRISLPSGFQPRAAVGYATVAALEVAALCGATASLREEVEAAAALLPTLVDELSKEAEGLARALRDTVPVFVGSGLTAPVAYRWKCQVNENANRAAFSSELPEMDHNEIEGWRDRSVLAPVFLEDTHASQRILKRFDLTADIIGGAHRAKPRGASRVERLFSLVLLGDLVSIYIAALHGTDPVDIPALQALKTRL